ncbi:integrin alpha-2-like [Sinocyclocheilus anshuiensis]|uniref:integrin alpha-2-like n=1 Tax=Sinocyclocheilus anshuiensis TaxID=1608454 RepID=UPI0007B7CDA0|nr:PREDICTED: integrin alpha-2-like [Sinocyclocheilus anshuiensis]
MQIRWRACADAGRHCGLKMNILQVLLAVLCFSITQDNARGFNVGTSGAKIFSVSAEQFGYSVKQFSNSQGKWLLVGSPWKGYPQNRKGEIYKCEINNPGASCQSLNLQNSVNVPTISNSNNINMSLGLTLIPTTKNGGFMTCGPLWAQLCGSQYFYPGVCADVSLQFTLQSAFSPAVQTCSSLTDIAIVLDGSNSIYPWEPIVAFLKKLLENLDIGPQSTQVSVMQYAVDTSFEFYLNSHRTKESMIKAALNIQQKQGLETNTFKAIDFARQNAFLAKNGGRPGATKVMVVVTDGESHDANLRNTVIPACESQHITRFGIAVLGYYIRNDIDTSKLIVEIKSIASNPTEKYFFNVSEEAALIEIVGTLGDRIFNIEGVGKGTGDNFKMEMSQVGFSAHQTRNKDLILLGAVGAYNWIGTVVHQTAQKSDVLPKSAFEKFLDDRNHSSLLGYSVTSVIDGLSEFYVTGAPRAIHRGQVIVYSINSQNQPVIIDSQRGDQIGSYFGSVLCPVDVDTDGVTDLLLVGAPMYMSEEKSETGRVHLFTITKGILSNQGFLEGSQKNARFGTAITVVPDLNLDGFSDVVVGAPLEGNGQGAVYIYNGDRKTIRKQSSQKIVATKLDPALKFFGRSLDGSGDMNGDSIPDVVVGAFGKVVQLWSRGVAVVTAKVSFTPDKISILSKPCRYIGRQVSCFKAKVCFSAIFKPANPLGPLDIKYNLTLDADLQSSRVSPRGHFSSLDRVIQKDMSVSAQDLCEEHDVYVQETPDLVNSIALRVDIVVSHADANPVLDIFSPTAWEFFIPFSKDCGQDDVCFSDLVLTVQSEETLGKTQLVVSQNKRRLSFTVTVMNRKENAYNARVSASYSSNLFYASVTPQTEGAEVKCTLMKESDTLICQVSYPALRTDQSVTFVVNFDFNLNQLQKDANVVFEALSDSTEETPADNKMSVSIPVQYNSEIILSRESNVDAYLLEKDSSFTTTVRNFKDIGPDFNFNLKVSPGTVPVSLVYLTVSLPNSTRAGNPLLYITSIKASPAEKIHCAGSHLIDPFKIIEKPYPARFTEESFRGTDELNCKTATCRSIQCVLKDLVEKNDYYVNVTTNIWKGTFTTADFLYTVLSVRADIETSQPELLFIKQKHLQVEVQVSKPGAKADVPVGVIIGSVIGGLLLLALAVALLWKLGFFKRKYQPMMNAAENGAEDQELQENSETP